VYKYVIAIGIATFSLLAGPALRAQSVPQNMFEITATSEKNPNAIPDPTAPDPSNNPLTIVFDASGVKFNNSSTTTTFPAACLVDCQFDNLLSQTNSIDGGTMGTDEASLNISCFGSITGNVSVTFPDGSAGLFNFTAGQACNFNSGATGSFALLSSGGSTIDSGNFSLTAYESSQVEGNYIGTFNDGYTYSYQGKPYTTFTGSVTCPSICGLSGSFTIPTALPAGQTTPTTVTGITAYSFTDGQNTLSSGDGSNESISVTTDGSGRLTGWQVAVGNSGNSVTMNTTADLGVRAEDITSVTAGAEVGTASNSDDAGSWAISVGGQLSPSGTGSSSIDFTINNDFSISGTATLPAGTLGACQTNDLSLSTAQAITDGDILGTDTTSGKIAGVAVGSVVEMAMDDGSGDQIWFIGSLNDADGNPLTGGQMFFSGYAYQGQCAGDDFIDKPFQKKNTFQRGPRLPNHRFPFPIRWEKFDRKFHEDLQGQGQESIQPPATAPRTPTKPILRANFGIPMHFVNLF
jgi:hypothetical protein